MEMQTITALVQNLPAEVYTGGGLALLVSISALYFFFLRSPKTDDRAHDLNESPSVEVEKNLEAKVSVEVKPREKEKALDKSPEKTSEPVPLKTLSEALSQTQKTLWGRMISVFSAKPLLQASDLEEIEEVLYTSDLGPRTVQLLSQKISTRIQSSPEVNLNSVRDVLREEMLALFHKVSPIHSSDILGNLKICDGLTVWMVIGVNGAGKTTTIGKLAGKLASQGKKVLVGAGDTFRAAADEQLKIWSQRASVEIFSPEGVKDPSAVAFDAINMAKSKNFDVVILDTAGRLHTQKNLMEELKKIKRVMAKVIPDAPHEVLLVLDGSMGQNALIQANEFNQSLEVTGVVLTKMDGTAKGGVAVGIAGELNLPVKMIGVGEGIDDLRPFEPNEFVHSII